MQQHFRDAATKGYLKIMVGQDDLHYNPYENAGKPYTVAWNRGEAQRLVVDETEHTIGKNQMALLVVEQDFTFDRPEDITAYQFNREFYCIVDHDKEVSCVGFIFYGLPSPMIIELDEAEIRSFDLLHQVFLEEFANYDTIQGEMLRMLLKRLIIKVTRIAKEQHLQEELPSQEYDLLREFNLLVEKNFRQYHQVQDYAGLLFKSPKTLSNLFKKAGAKSPLKIIQERISLEAKRLLRYTDKDVAEIGYDLGFVESSHFSRFFKKMEGMSPGAFRKG
ncbi:AraC family transcriptional regulator [Lewinella sp. 4G2]|uniref:helix-turn-helix domain-containing protein n=1 Tax=Lewinella sp. 4G2 TaxID=1803372 RepID=UPI0007B48E47|nr:AraC family transcriptional regulator [Lewinella sp. 4G2]OAV42940.1 AraC family transcriptional regulator [Lewinella sp. 4G2]